MMRWTFRLFCTFKRQCFQSKDEQLYWWNRCPTRSHGTSSTNHHPLYMDQGSLDIESVYQQFSRIRKYSNSFSFLSQLERLAKTLEQALGLMYTPAKRNAEYLQTTAPRRIPVKDMEQPQLSKETVPPTPNFDESLLPSSAIKAQRLLSLYRPSINRIEAPPSEISIHKLKQELAEKTNLIERNKIEANLKIRRLEAEFEKSTRQISELEQTRRQLFEDGSKLKAKCTQLENANIDLQKQVNELTKTYDETISQLNVECSNLRHSKKDLEREKQQNLHSFTEIKANLESQCLILSNEIESKDLVSTTLKSTISMLEEELEILKNQTQMSSSTNQTESEVIQRGLLGQASRVHELEASNRKLRLELDSLQRIVQSNAVLEEKIYSLETQLSKIKQLEAKLIELERENADLRLVQSNAKTTLLGEIAGKEQLSRALELAKLYEEIGQSKEVSCKFDLERKQFAESESLLRKEVGELREALETKENELNRLRQQYSVASLELSQMNAQLENARLISVMNVKRN